MSLVKISGNASGTGTFTIASPNSNTDRTITLPDNTGTILTTGSQIEFGAGTVSAPSISTSGDTNTGIYFPAADTIAFAEGGAEAMRIDSSGNLGLGVTPSAWSANNQTLEGPYGAVSLGTSQGTVLSAGAYYNSGWKYKGNGTARAILLDNNSMQFLTAASGTAGNAITFTQAMTLDASGLLAIGRTSAWDSNALLTLEKSGVAAQVINSTTNTVTLVNVANGSSSVAYSGTASNHPYYFITNGSERARITSGGSFVVAGTSAASSSSGSVFYLGPSDAVFQSSGITTIYVNRNADDGTLIDFRQANVSEGSISITGNSTNYNPFLGSHSGALADWSRPEIKIGTVMDTIDELLKYKVVVIDVQEEVPAKEAVLDEEGNEVQPAQEAITQTVQKRISYNGNGAVGSSATVEYEGQEYTGIIHNEREEPLSFNKHVKVKVNDTAASKAVFGVFVGWNTDKTNDGGVYNDMLVGAVGNYVIRMAAGQEPQIGDLVEADGNGCAVVQDDDIIRTKTVAKVTSTIKQVTYDDGSFLVTCVLYCG